MGLTKVTYSMVCGAPLNILDFGAVPNDETAASANVVAIQAALDAALALGFGKVQGVYIPAGTFVIDADITVGSSVSLFGDGDQSIIKLKADVPAGTYNMLKITSAGANSVVMRDFSLWGDNNNQVNNPTVYGIRVTPTSSASIYNRFENLYIKEMNSSAVYIDQSGMDNSQFVNCMFRDSKGSANFLLTSGEQLDIQDCRVRSGKGAATHGILVNGTSVRNCSIVGCRIEENSGVGIYVSNTSDRFEIANNTLVYNESGGVVVDRADSTVVANNILLFTDTYGVYVESSTNVVVEGNAITSQLSGPAIYLRAANKCLTASNAITDVRTAASFGIQSAQSNYSSVVGNLVTEVYGTAISLVESSYNNVSSNTIVNAGTATDDTYYGILVDTNSDYNLLNGNKVSANAANKVANSLIIGAANCDANVVINNDLLGYATAGLQNSGTGTVTVSANRT